MMNQEVVAVPTYEYRCVSCEHQFERFQRMSDDPITECEACGQTVKRLLFPVAIHFKGSGFYTTDYGKRNVVGSSACSNGGGSSAEGSSSPSSKSGEGASKSSESSGSAGKAAEKPSGASASPAPAAAKSS